MRQVDIGSYLFLFKFPKFRALLINLLQIVKLYNMLLLLFIWRCSATLVFFAIDTHSCGNYNKPKQNFQHFTAFFSIIFGVSLLPWLTVGAKNYFMCKVIFCANFFPPPRAFNGFFPCDCTLEYVRLCMGALLNSAAFCQLRPHCLCRNRSFCVFV